MMVVPAYFAARNMAILADYPCYHWVNWEGDGTPPTPRPTRRATSPTCARCSTSSTRTRSRAGSATRSTAAGTAASCWAGSGATPSSAAHREHRRGRARRGPDADAGALPAAIGRRARRQPADARGACTARRLRRPGRPRRAGARHQGERAGPRPPRRRDLDDAEAGVLAARRGARAAVGRAP